MGGLLGCTTPFIWTMPGLLLAGFPVLFPVGLSVDGLLLAALPRSPFLRDIAPSVSVDLQSPKSCCSEEVEFLPLIIILFSNTWWSHVAQNWNWSEFVGKTSSWLPPWIYRFLRVQDADSRPRSNEWKSLKVNWKPKKPSDSTVIRTVKKQLLKEKNRQRLLITWLARCLLFVDARAPVAVRGAETPFSILSYQANFCLIYFLINHFLTRLLILSQWPNKSNKKMKCMYCNILGLYLVYLLEKYFKLKLAIAVMFKKITLHSIILLL